MFFSGFGFNGEKIIFDRYIKDGCFNVSGFSLGAIDAFEYAFKNLHKVRKVQLISPAFFQDKDDIFKQKQLEMYDKNKEIYLKKFYKNISSKFDFTPFKCSTNRSDLYKLLYYTWEDDKMNRLKDNSIEIEVFIGLDDKIVDPKATSKYFGRYATVYELKKVGHALI